MTSDQEHKPSSRLVRYQWPVILTLGVALFLGAIGGSFYLYVQDRERYYNDRYFRLLNSQANDVGQRLESYREVMYSAGDIGLLRRARIEKKDEKKKDDNDKSDALPKVVNEKNDEVPWRELFLQVRSTRCLRAPLAKLADTIGKQLCQIPDFSNVNVYDLSEAGEANPYLEKSVSGISAVQEEVARKENSLHITQDTGSYIIQSVISPEQEKVERGKKPLPISQGASKDSVGSCTPNKGFRRAANAANNAYHAFGIDTLGRSSSSIFVVEALVEGAPEIRTV